MLFCPIYTHHQNDYPGLNVKEYYNLLFQKSCPLNLQFASGCQYIVSKKKILERPKKFYEFVYNLINNNDININNYHVAHFGNNIYKPNSMSVWCLERFLLYIFDSKYTNNYNCSDPIF